MNKTNKKNYIKIILSSFIGALLGAVIVYLTKKQFPYEGILGALIGGIILTLVQQIKIKYKKNDIPEVDERISNNLFKFFAYVSHATLGLIFITLSIFSSLGNKFISLNYIWLIFSIYFLIIVVGGFIIKKK